MGILTDYETGITSLENWLTKTQPHLPIIDKIILKRFVHSCNGDLEKTKKLIEVNYTMRNNYSNIFLKRDPCDEAAKIVLETTDMIVLPSTTPDGSKVLFYRLNDPDSEKFNATETIKMFFMLADSRFIKPDLSDEGDGEIPIFDMTGFSLRHLAKLVPSLRVYMKFAQEAQPVKLKSIHIINCSSYLDKVIAVIKPFAKSHIFKMTQFHLPGSESLYKTVPKEMLPIEYGGKSGPIATIKDMCIERLKANRDYIMDEKFWKIYESKRIKNKDTMEMNGNFRALSID